MATSLTSTYKMEKLRLGEAVKLATGNRETSSQPGVRG